MTFKIRNITNLLVILILMFHSTNFELAAQTSTLPSMEELNKPFGIKDSEMFKEPTKSFKPETWFHFIGGNISKEGITADLEAIATAGFSGIQLFHGQFGGAWPGVEPQITCLSPLWDDAIEHVGKECQRLGLNFTMQNCPGWAMSGGPWIKPSNAMRHLVSSRTDISNEDIINLNLPIPQPSNEPWRDYRDIKVLAFQTPEDDNDESLIPTNISSNFKDSSFEKIFVEKLDNPIVLSPTTSDKPHWIEVSFSDASPVRTIVFPSVQSFNHSWCYDPGVSVKVEAVMADGSLVKILKADMPQSNWQDNMPISLACDEINGTNTYRISIVNAHEMRLNSLHLLTAARKNNWESEAGWTLRSIVRGNEHPKQSKEAFIDPNTVKDISSKMDSNGELNWKAPSGKWTILRIGHVNTGRKNGPAPPAGTGWESNKLSESGPNAQFGGYIGKLTSGKGPIQGLLNGVLMDSWECETQTWTEDMEFQFNRINNYELDDWLPAIFGYVIKDHETTTKFLRDWKVTISDLYTNKFYGQMANLAHKNGQFITFETAAGDVFPGDILEYFKYADIPMCEFWQHPDNSFVGSINFKPIEPTVSAARLYGKTRVAAEAFTSFSVSWNEHLSLFKETANLNLVKGVTHLVFHTYTHNPRTDFLPPGSSFGSIEIGSPFLRGQTWWKYMPEFTNYLARSSYLLERGKPVSDVLWYLGDEINHKPDQNNDFPIGFKYDYFNPDILLNRLTVKNGLIETPEGIQYTVLYLPDTHRMLPRTLEKLLELVKEGATIIGEAPDYLATLSNSDEAQKLFDKYVSQLWGEASKPGIRKVGKGKVVSGIEISQALELLKIEPDVIGGNEMWLHRKTDQADWYYVCAPKGKGFKKSLSFRNKGNVEIWDPLTGNIQPIVSTQTENRTEVLLDLPQAGSCFIVFRKTNKKIEEKYLDNSLEKPQQEIALQKPWTLNFPVGWGTPSSIKVNELKAWKDLNLNSEAKAFSGTGIYTTTFDVENIKKDSQFVLDLGQVEMIADVWLNGKSIQTLWSLPYKVDLTEDVRSGENDLVIKVTNSWFNRLVFDANQTEDQRKTWTIKGPSKDEPLKDSGLIGPVKLYIIK